MKPDFDLTDKPFNTCYAPLCVVGHRLRDQNTLGPLLNVAVISQKIRDHTPGEKLMDAFLLIMAGYPSLYLLNQHLRPDPMLAHSWGQSQLAEQSTISRLLDRFDETALDELQALSWQFWSVHSRLPSHDWRKKLIVDLDLTPLLASPRAQGSTKGYLGKKNATGRQLARVMLYPYRETLISQLYPGWQHSSNCLQPAVETFEQRLDLPPQRRHKIVWRLDGGFGGDHNIEYLVGRGYHVLAKGASNRRAAKLATQVQRWRAVRSDKWVAQVPTPEQFSRPVRTFVLRTHVGQKPRLAYLYSTLSASGLQTVRLYDQRGGAETEFRADKSGGGQLHKRRKHKRDAQEV